MQPHPHACNHTHITCTHVCTCGRAHRHTDMCYDIFIYTYTHRDTHRDTHRAPHTHTHTHIDRHTHTQRDTHTHKTRTHTHTHMHVCMHACTKRAQLLSAMPRSRTLTSLASNTGLRNHTGQSRSIAFTSSLARLLFHLFHARLSSASSVSTEFLFSTSPAPRRDLLPVS